MLKLKSAISLVVIIILAWVMAACGDPTSTPVLPTATPQPTATAVPPTPILLSNLTNPSTPLPIPAPGTLIPEAGLLCDKGASLAQPVVNTLKLPIFGLRKDSYSNQWGFQVVPVILGHNAKNALEIKSLVCIFETQTKVGFYTNGRTAYDVTWDVRILSWPDGEIIGTSKFFKLAPSSLPNPTTPEKEVADWIDLLANFIPAKLNTTLIATLQGHTDRVNYVAWSPDGKTLASASADKTVRLWSAEGKELAILNGHSGWVNNVAWSPDGKTLASTSTSRDNTIKLWNADGKELATLKGRTNSFIRVAWSPDGKILAFPYVDGGFKLWSADGKELATLGGSTLVNYIVWSPDGKFLASDSYDKIRLWNAEGKELDTLKGSYSVRSIKWSPDGKFLAFAFEHERILLWSVDTKQIVATLTGSNGSNDIVWSPDGKILAFDSNDTVGLWSVDGKELATLNGSIQVHDITWSPDSKIFAFAYDDNKTNLKSIELWSATGEELVTLPGQSSSVRSIAWSPDGKTLASASEDKTIKLWKVS